MNPLFVKEQRRCNRYPLTLSMTIRRSSRGDINKIGETRNIGPYGVYFLAPQVIELGTLLEFDILFPEDVYPPGQVRVMCKGKVTRVEQKEQSLVGVASTIERYEIKRT